MRLGITLNFTFPTNTQYVLSWVMTLQNMLAFSASAPKTTNTETSRNFYHSSRKPGHVQTGKKVQTCIDAAHRVVEYARQRCANVVVRE
jgi:hypothetical protein